MMIDSYKNVERLRYRMNRDIVTLYSDIKKTNNEQRALFVEECFSAVASSIAALFLTQELFLPFKTYISQLGNSFFNKTIPEGILNIIALVISMALLIFVAVFINWIILKIKKGKEKREPEGIDTIDHIKEFDNIACDSVFVAIDYKNAFLGTNDDNVKTLLFFEIVHYLKTACDITKKLCENEGNIKSPSNITGVDLYRIHNIKDVMNDLYVFIASKEDDIYITPEDKDTLKKQLDGIKGQLNKLP